MAEPRVFAAFWGGGAGSEVLSTEEMKSKHPRTSLKPQGGKAGFNFSRTVSPGLGKPKVQPRVREKGKRRGVSASDTEEVRGRGRPHTWEVERTESLSQAGKASSRGADLRPWPDACFQQCPATQLGTCLRSHEYTPSWGRSCECLLFQYVPFL